MCLAKSLFTLSLLSTLSCFAQTSNTIKANSSSGYDYAKSHIITPSAAPELEGSADLFVDADFIYWTPRQTGMAFAETNFIPTSGETAPADNQTYPQSRVIYTKNKYSPGFKAGLGLMTDHDNWDIYLQFTWLRSNPTTPTQTGSNTEDNTSIFAVLELIDHFPFEFASSEILSGNSNWKLRFNNFDLELGRSFYLSRYLTLRPHVGLKGGWQTQRWNSFWMLNNAETDVYSDATYLIRQTQKQWNVGLRTGIDASWLFTRNWSLYGDFALSGVWTQFTTTRKDKATTSGGEVSVSNFQTFNELIKYHVVVPVVELALGLRFDWYFVGDDYRFRFQAGWENQVWLNQNNFTGFLSPYFTPGLLSLQGLTIKARLDF